MLKLSKSLNLVTTVEASDGRTLRIHSVPIGVDVYDEYFLPMSKAWAAIFSEGLSVLAGVRVAYRMLRKVSQDMGIWDDVERGLINEIVRLSNVAMIGDNGWTTLPLDVALKRDLFDDETVADIKGELLFFTLVSKLNKKAQVPAIMETVGALWGSQTTYLDFMEYKDSLPTLTEGESTTIPTSSVPV